MPRWITDVKGISNFRDLATGPFPEGLVYRSADLSQLEHPGLVQLSSHICTIVDIRSLPEIRRNGTIGLPVAQYTDTELAEVGIKRIHAPIFLESDYSPAAIAKRHQMYQSGTEGFIEAYRGILDNLGPTIRIVFRELASNIKANKTQGILIHCSAGKDRTGILCALLLLLAGTTPEDVATEYALTTQGLAEQHERILASLGTLVTAQDKETARVMMSSEAVVMQRTIKIIDAEYGGAEALIRKHVDLGDYNIIRSRIRRSSGKL